MQDTGAALLHKAKHTGAKQFSRCNRSSAHHAEGVQIMADVEGRAWYRGLKTCGAVWICPICAEKVSKERAEGVQQAIDAALVKGRGVSLVTLTFRHSELDTLENSLDQFTRATRSLKSGREYSDLRAAFGILGEVRALEVTHGASGWHPHSHAVTFSDNPLNENAPRAPVFREANKKSKLPGPTLGIKNPVSGHRLTQLKRALFRLWYRAMLRERLAALSPLERKAMRRPRRFASIAHKKTYRMVLKKIGLPSYAHGVDVRPANHAADYVAKWGFAAELTRPHLKKGHKGGRSPFQLLADATNGDKRAARLWAEFATRFSGKRQLFWSKESVEKGETARDVRDVLGLEKIKFKSREVWRSELSDQEIIEFVERKGREVARLVPDDWLIVRRFRARAALLDAAVKGYLADFLEGLRAKARERYGSDGRGNRRAFWAMAEMAVA